MSPNFFLISSSSLFPLTRIDDFLKSIDDIFHFHYILINLVPFFCAPFRLLPSVGTSVGAGVGTIVGEGVEEGVGAPVGEGVGAGLIVGASVGGG